MRTHSSATRDIFDALDVNGANAVSSQYLIEFLRKCGLLSDDPRLKGLFDYLASLEAIGADRPLSLGEFDAAISNCSTLIHKVRYGDS